jgi:predicted deacylase
MAGDDVRKGQPIGRLHDFTDHTSAPVEVFAHRDGVVVALHFGAACRRGATLYVIAEDVPR